ncbi:MAG: hypothetical protein IJD36_04475 [Clostridia bacterium]|nr:hypothetical protein [Clostridia bacterium]
MKELKFEELTLKQKLGMVYTAFLNSWAKSEDNEEFIFELIKERALGAVWIQQGFRDDVEMLKKVNELADYPIIICTDAESGMKTPEGDFLVGRHSAVSNAGDLKYAYAFGKVSGTLARKMGYNMICAPILDIKNGNIRSFGADKERVAEVGVAVAKGYKDSGILPLAKHYPGGDNPHEIDPHMTAKITYLTKEELIEDTLYPYVKLMENDLLDGIMSGHEICRNIDPKNPASMSKDVMNIIRELGFEGLAMTDALCMMGVKALYSDVEAEGYAIAAGNDTILPFSGNSRKDFSDLCEAYENGLFKEEDLNTAVKRVLATQHKILSLKDDAKITDEEMENFMNIDKKGIYQRLDEGVPKSISRDGNHYFAVMVRCDANLGTDGKVDVDTYNSSWFYPEKIEKKIKELFPNSKIDFYQEFPSQAQNVTILNNSLGCDQTIFVTFTEPLSFTGKEYLTRRLISLISAMQMTDRVTGLIHFGNPTVLGDLPHIPRIILGSQSQTAVETAFGVLAGEYEAEGVLSCEVSFK